MAEDNSTSTITFDFEFVNVSGLLPKGDSLYSESFILRGLSWNITVWRKDTKYLGVYLQCEHEQEEPNWSCHVQAKLSLLSKIHGIDDISRSIEHSFNSLEYTVGFSRFISWRKVTDPSRGYIENDTITIRAYVTADHPIGVEVTKSASESESENDDEAKKKEVSDDNAPVVDHPIRVEVTESASETKSENDDEAKKKEVGDDDGPVVDHPIRVEVTESASETKSENDDEAKKKEVSDDNAPVVDHPIRVEVTEPASETESANDDETKKEKVSDDIASAVDHPIDADVTELVSEIESKLSMSSESHVNAPIGQATEAESPSPTINESDKNEQKSSEAEVSQREQESTAEKSYSEMCLLS